MTPHLIAGLVMMVFSIWSLIVLFNGFKTSTGLKGAKCGAGYALGVILAEAATMALLYWLY